MIHISGTTKLGGLLGSPVAHSLSPAMHNDSFAHLGIDAVYLCFDVGRETLAAAVEGLRALNVYGFNITMPDKEAVLPLLDHLSDAASLIGAVNTVCNQDGVLTGHNTDGTGFLNALREEGCVIKGSCMTLFGCGGAGKAIAVQAALDGLEELNLVCRHSASWPKAEALIERIRERTSCRASLIDAEDLSGIRSAFTSSSMIINATSAGMEPNTQETCFAHPEFFPSSALAGDVIYHPRETRFLREAREAGCRTMNGMYMLLYQGAEAFRLWTGQDMPVSLIRERYFRKTL